MSESIKANFGRAAASYDEHAQLQQVVREESIALARDLWADDATILDVGHGTGNLMQDINNLGLSWQVVGSDIALGMCAVAHTRNPTVVNADADALPFADNSFDGVFSSLMLQWSPDPLKTLREMRRVIRPGGFCVLSTFTHGTLSELEQSFTALDDALHINQFIEYAHLSAYAVHAGFTMISCEEETFTSHYPDVVSLMRGLKSIGASAKLGSGNKGLMTRSQLARLEQAYREKFADDEGLPSTWQVMTMALEKTA